MPCPLPYLAVYEVEADDPAEVLKTLNATRRERGQSDALNQPTAGGGGFSETGPKHERD
jgi:hypothetical protein